MHRPAGHDLETYMSAGAARGRPELAPSSSACGGRSTRTTSQGPRRAARAARGDRGGDAVVRRAPVGEPGRCGRSTRAPAPTRTGGSRRGSGSRSSRPGRSRTSSSRSLVFFAVYATGAPSDAHHEVAAVSSGNARPGGGPAGRRPRRRRRRPHRAHVRPVSRLIRASHGRPITLTVKRDGHGRDARPARDDLAGRPLDLGLRARGEARLVPARLERAARRWATAGRW